MDLRRVVACLGVVAAAALPAWAHRPVFDDGTHIDAESALLIEEPNVSQVVYHEVTLDAARLWLTFDASNGDNIYLQLGVPAINTLKDYRPVLALLGPGLPSIDLPFEVPSGLGGVLLQSVDKPAFFDEPFTGTQSWILRESDRAALETGQYYVVAYDPDGISGKLWVSIGRAEEFGFEDILSFSDIIVKVRAFHEVSGEPMPLLTRILYTVSRILAALLGIFGFGGVTARAGGATA
ncbi:MAG: hypothetical protein HZB26_05435 [Candidatus Hydrogenedentes bacterium]|nr:hypothetical protein [Candidatus Hydrogenedentota bacterium]